MVEGVERADISLYTAENLPHSKPSIGGKVGKVLQHHVFTNNRVT